MSSRKLREQRWQEVAHGVKQDHDEGKTLPECVCKQNALLLEFLRSMLEVVLKEGDEPGSKFPMVVKKAALSVESWEKPIFDRQSLLAVKFIGKSLAQIIINTLWTVCPPDPPQGTRKRSADEMADDTKKRKRKTYCPTIGSANYAFLIMLYKSCLDGEPHLSKEELMRRTDASALSNMSIYGDAPNYGGINGVTRPARSFYSGWSNFKTLRNQETPLVTTWSNPMKIKLTEEGQKLAQTLYDDAVNRGTLHVPAESQPLNLPETSKAMGTGESAPTGNLDIDTPFCVSDDESEDLQVPDNPEQGSQEIDICDLIEDEDVKLSSDHAVETCPLEEDPAVFSSHCLPKGSCSSEPFLFRNWQLPFLGKDPMAYKPRVPPLRANERFRDVYEIVLLVDNREQFSSTSAGPMRELGKNEHMEQLRGRNVKAEMRQLAQGDALWIARSIQSPAVEYVLDYIVERKNVDDLVQSIKSKRYEQQKYWIMKSGLRHKMYLVEGDLDYVTAGACARTACFTTEILDGFSVVRTRTVADTLNTYAQFTKAIINLFMPLGPSPEKSGPDDEPLMVFEEFNERIAGMKRLCVRDVWGLMLMNVHGVGAEIATGILKEFPTPISLFRHYERIVKEAIADGSDPVLAGQKALAKIPAASSRSVGQAVSKGIFNSLFKSNWRILGL